METRKCRVMAALLALALAFGPWALANGQAAIGDLLEEVGVVWISQFQKGPADSEPVLIAHQFVFGLEPQEGAEIASARFLPPGREPEDPDQWIALEPYDDEWEYKAFADTMAELETMFPLGDYVAEVTPTGGAPVQMTVTAPGTMTQPTSIPKVTAPYFGQSDAGETEVNLEWAEAADPDDFDIIEIWIEDFLEGLDTDATSLAVSGLEENRVYEGAVSFANINMGETDGVEVWVVRINDSFLLFGTNTVEDRFGMLEEMYIFQSDMAGPRAYQSLTFGAEFDEEFDMDELVGHELFMPTNKTAWLDRGENNVSRQIRDDDDDHWPHVKDGWYALILEFDDGSAAVTPLWFGVPDTNDPLAMPGVHPVLVGDTPGEGDAVESPVAFEWDWPNGPDPDVNAWSVSFYRWEDWGWADLDEFFSRKLDDRQHVEHERLNDPARYRADLWLENVFDPEGNINPDGVPVEVGKAKGADREFFIHPAGGGQPFLWISLSPVAGEAGEVLNEILVEIRNEDGLLLVDDGREVSITIKEDTGMEGAELSGTTERYAVGGMASFNDLSIDLAGDGYQLTASAEGAIPADSPPFDILGVGLTLTAPNGGEMWEQGTLQTITWQAVNVEGDVELEYSIDGGESWKPIGVVPASAEEHPVIIPDDPSQNCLVRITSVENPGLFDVSDAPFTIIGSPDVLAFGVQPSDVRATEDEEPVIFPAPTVEIRDSAGSVVPSSTASVNLSLQNDDGVGDAELRGTFSVDAVAGIATFDNLRVTHPGEGFFLRASSGEFDDADSETFNVIDPADDPEVSDAIEEVGAFWGSHYYRGPAGGAVFVQHFFEFEVDAGMPLEWAKFRLQGEAEWRDMEQDDEDGMEWRFRQADGDEATGMDNLIAAFPPDGPDAIYEVLVKTAAAQVELQTAVAINIEEHPNQAPVVETPHYGQSGVGVGEGAVDITIKWGQAADPNFNAVVVMIEDVEDDALEGGGFGDDEFLGPDADEHQFAGVPGDRVYEGFVLFANTDEGENADRVKFFAARFNESRLLFDTTRVNRFDGVLDEMALIWSEGADQGHGVRKSLHFMAEFSNFLGNLGVKRANLWTPTDDIQIFPIDPEGNGGDVDDVDSLDHRFTGHNGDWELVKDGWYALELIFEGVNGAEVFAVTPIWLGETNTDAFLIMPAEHPVLQPPTPGQDERVDSPVNLQWAAAADPNVTAVSVQFYRFGDEKVLEEMLPPGATAFGPQELDPALYKAWVGFDNLREGFANADGVAIEVAKIANDDRDFYVKPAGDGDFLWFAQGPADVAAGQVFDPPLKVELRDNDGRLIDEDNVQVEVSLWINEGPGELIGTTLADVEGGVAVFDDLEIRQAGERYTLKATLATLDGFHDAESARFNVSAADPHSLAFEAAPGSAVAGEAFDPAPVVHVLDEFGNLADSGAAVTLSLAEGTLSGEPTTVNAANGIATFPGLSIELAGDGYKLEAASEGLAGAVSGEFHVAAADADRLSFEVSPAETVAGEALLPAPVVHVLDRFGNLADSGAAVTLSLAEGSPEGGALLGEPTTVNAVNGIANFPDLKIELAGTGYKLEAASGDLAPDDSNPFNIVPAAPAALFFAVSPEDTPAGAQLNPVPEVHVHDSFGNHVTEIQGVQVTLELAGNVPVGAELVGDNPVNADGGIARFDNLAVGGAAGEGLQLKATSEDILDAEAISEPFDITAEPALQIVKEADKEAVDPGEAVTFTITYRNTGLPGAVATGVVVRETIPAGTTYVVGSASGVEEEHVNVAGGVITWNVDDLAGGDDKDLTFQVIVDESMTEGGKIHNDTYSIAAEGIAPVPGAQVVVAVNDKEAPKATLITPAPNRRLAAPRDTVVLVEVTDAGSGVDLAHVEIKINDKVIYYGGDEDAEGGDKYTSRHGVCRRSGDENAYRFHFIPDPPFAYGLEVEVKVNARDNAENAMAERQFAFAILSRPFGPQFRVNAVANGVVGPAAVAQDAEGSVWAAWEQEVDGARRIWVGKLPHDSNQWEQSVLVHPGEGGFNQQHAPAAAYCDHTDALFVAWEQTGVVSGIRAARLPADAAAWEEPAWIAGGAIPLNEGAPPEYRSPALAADGQGRVYAVWKESLDEGASWFLRSAWHEDGAGWDNHEEVPGGDALTEYDPPALAVGSHTKDLYVAWTGTNPVLPALLGASRSDAWDLAPVRLAEHVGFPSRPALAAEADAGGPGDMLHLVWSEQEGEVANLYYLAVNTDDLPFGELPQGVPVCTQDEAAGSSQTRPAVLVDDDNGLVFVAWQDDRQSIAEGDQDVLFAEKRLGDEGFGLFAQVQQPSAAVQERPALALRRGQPLVLWQDTAAGASNLAGATSAGTTPVSSKTFTPDARERIEPVPAAKQPGIDVPAGAVEVAVEIVVSRVENPPPPPPNGIGVPWDFGPSGLTFNEDALPTIEMPVTDADLEGLAEPYQAYWYDESGSATEDGLPGWTQQGVRNVRYESTGPGIGVIKFEVEHFTMFSVGGSQPGVPDDGVPRKRRSHQSIGCSMPGVAGAGDAVLLLLPSVAAAALALRSARKRRNRRN